MVDVQVKDLTVLWDHRGGGDCHREGFDLQWVWPPGQRGTKWLKSKKLSLESRALFRAVWEMQGSWEKSYKDPERLPAQGQP